MDDNNPKLENQEQAPGTEQNNKMLDDGSVVASSFVDGIDMEAINDAVDASKFTTAEPQDSINVDDIDLDNTPMSDEELNARLEKDPSMSLAGKAKEIVDTPVAEAFNASQESMSSISANIDRTEKPKEEKKEDPSINDAPTVSEAIIAPPRRHTPVLLIVILIVLIAAAAIGIKYFLK